MSFTASLIAQTRVRRFDSVKKREREREFRQSHLLSESRSRTKCIHDTFVSCLPMRRRFRGTARVRNEISLAIRQTSYVRIEISAFEGSLKVQLFGFEYDVTLQTYKSSSSANFQNASSTLRIRATFVFLDNFNV